MEISAKKIAELSGFSQTTVSNVLNNRGGYSDETRNSVLQVASEIGYKRRPPLKEDTRQITFVIFQRTGRVVEDTAFFSQLFSGVANECEQNGFSLEMINLDYRNNLFESSLNRILEKSQGLLFLGTEMDESFATMLINSGKKIVFLDNWLDSMKVSVVSINNIKSAFAATEHLIECGHRKIGYLKSKYRINNFKHRANGYRLALGNYNLERELRMEIPLEPNINGAYKDMTEFLRHNRIVSSAFFADNDNIAFGACKALLESGYRIPDDVSIIGFDDLPYCTAMRPSLSTVRVPKIKLGQLAVKELIKTLNGEEQSVHILVNTEIVKRDSVKIID